MHSNSINNCSIVLEKWKLNKLYITVATCILSFFINGGFHSQLLSHNFTMQWPLPISNVERVLQALVN